MGGGFIETDLVSCQNSRRSVRVKKRLWISRRIMILTSLSVSHDASGAKITGKIAPGPYILKRTGSCFFRTGGHSQNSRKGNFELF